MTWSSSLCPVNSSSDSKLFESSFPLFYPTMATFVPNLHSGTAASILAPSTALASNSVHAFLLPGDHSLTHSGSWLSAALLRPFSLAQPGEGEISLIIFLQNTPRVQHWRVSDLLIYWLCVMWVDVAYMSCK